MEPNVKPPCPDCSILFADLSEQLRRKDSILKRMKADLDHLKMQGTQVRAAASEEIAADMPDPDVFPEPSTPTARYVKRPLLDL